MTARSTLACLALLLGLGLAASACHAPRRAYGLPQIDFRRVAPTGLPAGARKSPTGLPERVVVMPLWTNQTPNPVGGLYDYTHYRVSPLYRTYFATDVAVPIWESCAGRLRAHGMRVYKDYSGSTTPALVKRPARDLDALVLRGELVGVVHDQLKQHFDRQAPGFQAVFVEVRLTLADLRGRIRWQRTLRVKLKVPDGPGLDLLRATGDALADQLVADLALRDAIAGRQPGDKGGA